MGISIISYNGQVTLGLMVDENLIQEPQLIMEHFARQFELLERHTFQMAGNGTAPDSGGAGPTKTEIVELPIENSALRQKRSRQQKP